MDTNANKLFFHASEFTSHYASISQENLYTSNLIKLTNRTKS